MFDLLSPNRPAATNRGTGWIDFAGRGRSVVYPLGMIPTLGGELPAAWLPA